MTSKILNELEFEFSVKPSDMEEFSQYLLDFKGRAIYWDDEADEKVVATMKGHRLDISRARVSFDNLQDFFDSVSPQISDLGHHIIQINNCFIEPPGESGTNHTPCGSLVYIDEIIVDPEYRNRSIGTEMMKRMSQIVDMNKTLVALKAFPILDDNDEERSPEQIAQLERFYEKLGFKHSGEHYMVKDARGCYAQRMRNKADEKLAKRSRLHSSQAGIR